MPEAIYGFTIKYRILIDEIKTYSSRAVFSSTKIYKTIDENKFAQILEILKGS